MPDLDDTNTDDDGLTYKQRRFCEFYLQTMNGTKAAKLAGYTGISDAVHAVTGSRLLRNANVNRYLERRFAEFKLGANEVLGRLSEIARADIGDYLSLYEYQRDGEIRIGWRIDLEKVIRDGKTNLIKSIKRDKYGVVIELHDQVKALELIGKHNRLFADIQGRTDAPDNTAKPEDLDEATLARIAGEKIYIKE